MLLPRRPRYVPRMQPSSLLLCVFFKSGMKKYVCEVSKAGTCTKSGSWLTPTLYGQMEAAANVSYILYCYDKFSTNLQTCRFVMVAFRDISRGECHGLEKHSSWICNWVGNGVCSS